MAFASPSVFVCGVTGNQGGALAKVILDLNWNFHTIVRKPDSDKAVSLAAAGVQLTRGDYDEEAALRTSIIGCSKVFINRVPTFDDFDRERRQAVLICNIAKEVGVEKVIASTNLLLEFLVRAELFSLPSKIIRTEGQTILEPGTLLHTIMAVTDEIEKEVKNIGLPSCIFLRPCYFMANFLEPMIDGYAELLSEGTLSTVLKADTLIGMTDHEDIAKVAVATMQNPERVNGHAIGIISECLTAQEILHTLEGPMRRVGLKALFLDPADIPVGSLREREQMFGAH